jgi:hypothetical protein
MKATLPQSIEPDRYYKTYVGYFAGVLQAAGVDVNCAGRSGDALCGRGLFVVDLDGHRFIVDYSDHEDCAPCMEPALPRFKYTYSRRLLPPDNKAFPFSPMSFYDWGQFERIRREVRYDAGETILFMQDPHRGQPPYERRMLLRRVIPEAFGERADTAMRPLEDYWRQINGALVRVFAPGTTNERLDRGHAQHLAFGCCTIAPPLSTVLPWYEPLEPGVHYVICKPDYSDVVDVIRWCDGHRDDCRRIGRAAAQLFERTSTPAALVRWLNLCLEHA